MDFSTKSQRQRPYYACLPLDIAGWCSARSWSTTAKINKQFSSDYSYEKLNNSFCYAPSVARPASMGRLLRRRLWRRILSDKRRISSYSSTSKVAADVPYDSCTYAQNFDEGSAWVEPENLSRTFTARFAASSAALRRF